MRCANCSHNVSEHTFADPKTLTKKDRKSGMIPWICIVDNCDCYEFIPRKE